MYLFREILRLTQELRTLLMVLFLVVFSFFEKTTYCWNFRLSVRPPVRPSVSIIYFCDHLISNWPFDPKIGLNVGYGVLHVWKAWFFKIRIATCKFLQFMLQFMQLIVVIAVFIINYHSYLSQQGVDNKGRSCWTTPSTRDTISIHNDYVNKSIAML